MGEKTWGSYINRTHRSRQNFRRLVGSRNFDTCAMSLFLRCGHHSVGDGQVNTRPSTAPSSPLLCYNSVHLYGARSSASNSHNLSTGSGSNFRHRRDKSPFRCCSHKVRTPSGPVYQSGVSHFIETEERNATLPFPAYRHVTSNPITTPNPMGGDDREDASDQSKEEEETPSNLTESPMPAPPPATLRGTLDDLFVERGIAPTRQVDYLSYPWEDFEVWWSWRYIRNWKAQCPQNTTRLENASWRSWAKSKYRLETITPDTLNW